MPPRVKICGLTRAVDVDAAVRFGADAVGFVFVPSSPRYLDLAQAASLCLGVPAFVTRVGLFLDEDAASVESVLETVPLSVLQFHGNESAGFCRRFGRPYIKAISMSSMHAIAEAEQAYPDAAAILVDSHAPGGMGGTGKMLDWSGLKAGKLPLILAGGLNSQNVAQAVRMVRPWAVDVSSGVEASPGIKDSAAIKRFIEEAKRE